MGGIIDSADAIEFIMAGAAAVAIGTGNFVNPMTAIEVIDGIKKYMLENRISRLNEMVIK
jgi:dihydroorotate dehydrogenase (NAD+) catalytic subunit